MRLLKNILRFWLDMGVDGFRIDIVPNLFETENYPDDPPCSSCNCRRSDYCFGYDPFEENQPRLFCTLSHIHTLDLPETYDMLYQWRELVDEYSAILMTEAYSEYPESLMRYYGHNGRQGAHFTFNFWLITQLNATSTAKDFKFIIEKWFSYMPVGHVANWVVRMFGTIEMCFLSNSFQLGNHDQHRVASRYGKRRVDGLNMLILMLPGVAVTYNGEEIGMEDGEITYEQGQDPQACNGEEKHFAANSRDFERTPYHWNGAINAGFSDGNHTWLPLSRKYLENNLEKQKNEGEKSHYGIYKKMVELRKLNAFRFGDLRVIAFSDQILGVLRFVKFYKRKNFLQM